MTKLARQFSLVTPHTSFMVLETLEQYLEYSIEPPTTLGEIRRAWLELTHSQKEQEKASEGLLMSFLFAHFTL